MLKDTSDKFGWISIGLHWINAALVLTLLYFGLQIALDYYYAFHFGFWDGGFVFEQAEGLPPGFVPPTEGTIPVIVRWPMIQFAVDWHEAVGIVAIPFLLIRVFWRGINGKPVTHHQPRLPHIVAETVWRVLLVGIVWQVISGPAWAWWRGLDLHFFDYFAIGTPWPLASPQEAFERHGSTLNQFLEYSHLFVALLIGVVVMLHAAGALKHHFIDKDVVLKRMLSPGTNMKLTSETHGSDSPSSS